MSTKQGHGGASEDEHLGSEGVATADGLLADSIDGEPEAGCWLQGKPVGCAVGLADGEDEGWLDGMLHDGLVDKGQLD